MCYWGPMFSKAANDLGCVPLEMLSFRPTKRPLFQEMLRTFWELRPHQGLGLPALATWEPQKWRHPEQRPRSSETGEDTVVCLQLEVSTDVLIIATWSWWDGPAASVLRPELAAAAYGEIKAPEPWHRHQAWLSFASHLKHCGMCVKWVQTATISGAFKHRGL